MPNTSAIWPEHARLSRIVGSQPAAKIMIVDDEPTTARLVRRYLEDVGFDSFVLHTDSVTAIDVIACEQPDVVLLDVMMPHVSGLEILSEIRQHEPLAQVPVIILTAALAAETKLAALELGAADFLAKPVDSSELILRVRNVLSAKALRDHLADYAGELERTVSLRTAQLTASEKNVSQGYRAGKAEIASEVLHNVGNVLNSLNVSVSLIRRALSETRLPLLSKATQLLANNVADPDFLRADQRGKMLPDYLVNLTTTLAKEHTHLLAEVKSVEHHLDHIKAVVATQQMHAGVSCLQEPVLLPSLIEDALSLAGLSRPDQEIEVVRHYDDVPEMMGDKQKLLQVFLNLLMNARQSMSESKGCAQRLTIRVARKTHDHVIVAFTDTGIGIASEHLTKIFAYGFTTRCNGTGVGLHSCANLVKELGGVISAVSKDGQGATFRMELPFTEVELS
jgi:signal transduction histidine kinase